MSDENEKRDETAAERDETAAARAALWDAINAWSAGTGDTARLRTALVAVIAEAEERGVAIGLREAADTTERVLGVGAVKLLAVGFAQTLRDMAGDPEVCRAARERGQR